MAQRLTAVIKTPTLIGVREEERDEERSQSLHREVKVVLGWLVGGGCGSQVTGCFHGTMVHSTPMQESKNT